MKRAFFILIGLLSIALAALYLWPAPPPASHAYFSDIPADRPEIIAHGGGQGHAPPNTLLALERAAAMGADILEADVQQTRDGVLILRHDDTLDRTTDSKGVIAETNWSKLAEVRAGMPMQDGEVDFSAGEARLATLDQALAAFPAARWILEIKNDSESAAAAMCKAIKQARAEKRVLVASFHDAAMNSFRKACPQVATSMSAGEVRNFVIAARLGLSHLVRTQAAAIHPPVAANGFDLTHPRIISAARTRGLRIHYWTINDPEEMRELLKAGADGLMTDYVDRGRKAVADFSGR